MTTTETPRISWDIGTAYDFFISLHVLHNPGDFGLRAAWAAGMRSRLPAANREFLEDASASVLKAPPFTWIYGLDAPKDGATALETLSELSPDDRLSVVYHDDEMPSEAQRRLREVAQRGSWDDADRDVLRREIQKMWHDKTPAASFVSGLLEYWSHPAEFGEQLLSALTAYYEVFFAEEERRIRPILDSELARAQDLATQLDFGSLVETLSQGVRLSYQHQKPEAVLIPSYWGAPFLFFGMADPDKEMLLFGARPKAASLVPGESVPDALVNALKSLADPTRLRILRYLVSEPLTPTQLARRLRLRAPTVIHHLHALRAAGLVYVMVGEGKEKAYQSRQEGILATCDMLSEFLENSEAAED